MQFRRQREEETGPRHLREISIPHSFPSIMLPGPEWYESGVSLSCIKSFLICHYLTSFIAISIPGPPLTPESFTRSSCDSHLGLFADNPD